MAAKPEAACLSQLALARLASGQRAPNPEESAHLESCAFCHAQLDAETALAHTAANEELPPAMKALLRSQTPRRSMFTKSVAHWQHGVMALLAIMAVGSVARELVSARDASESAATALTAAAPVEHAKGSVQIFGAVKTGQDAVRALGDLEHLSALHPGDTLQLQVQSFDKADVTLTDADDHTVYYKGEVPEDGWLPVGVEVTSEGPLHVTLEICPRVDHAPCITRELR